MNRYSIQIVPDTNCKKEIHDLMTYLSRKLGKKDALMDRAHITIVTSFKTKKIDSLIDEIKNLKLKSFCSKLTGPYLWDENFLYLKPKNNENICEIHNKIIELIPKYRIKWVHEGFQNINISGKQKKYLEKYGDIYCKEFFLPHLTLAGFQFQGKNILNARKLTKNKKEYEITANKILVLKKSGTKWFNYKSIRLNAN